MDPILASLFEHFRRLHESCNEILSGLTKEALDWSPGESMNSIAVLVTHVAGSEKFWIGDIAMQEPSGRVREAEFIVKGDGAAHLSSLLDSSLAYIQGAFARLTRDDLDQPRTSPLDGKTYDVAWSIAQSLAHTALHLGHIQLTRQLVDEGR